MPKDNFKDSEIDALFENTHFILLMEKSVKKEVNEALGNFNFDVQIKSSFDKCIEAKFKAFGLEEAEAREHVARLLRLSKKMELGDSLFWKGFFAIITGAIAAKVLGLWGFLATVFRP